MKTLFKKKAGSKNLKRVRGEIPTKNRGGLFFKSFLGWFICILIFTILYLIEDLANEKAIILSSIVMFIGSIFFIIMVFSLSARLSSRLSGIVRFFIFLIALSFFSVGGVVAVAYPLSVLSDIKVVKKNKNTAISYGNTNITNPEPSPKITSSTINENTYKYTPYLSGNKIDSGYIHCIFPHSGTWILKRQDCEILIDCEVYEGLWIPLTKEECKNKQEKYLDQVIDNFLARLELERLRNSILSSTPPPIDLNVNLSNIESPVTNLEEKDQYGTNNTNAQGNTNTEQQKIECQDSISAYYRDRIKDLQAQMRARGVSNSSYAYQEEKKLIEEMYRQIKLQCGL